MGHNRDDFSVGMLLVEGRDCGECKACCEVLGIDTCGSDDPLRAVGKGRVDLVKGEGPLCEHWQGGVGCGVYYKRPIQCEAFYCLWMVTDAWPEEYRPDRLGIIWTTQLKPGKLPYVGADTYNAAFDVFNKPEVRDVIENVSRHLAVIIRHNGRRFLINSEQPFPTEGDLHVF